MIIWFNKMLIQKDVILRYLNRKAAEIEELKEGLSQMDYEVLFNIGHKLKGNGTTFGFSDISELGNFIEQAAINKDRIKLEEYINILEVGIIDKLKTINH